jgi:hypothetical protein
MCFFRPVLVAAAILLGSATPFWAQAGAETRDASGDVTLAEIDAALVSAPFLEGMALDLIRRIDDALAAPDAILLGDRVANVTTMPRNDLRDMAGTLYDYLVHLGVPQTIAEFLPEPSRTLVALGVETGLGRSRAIDRAMAEFERRQPALRTALTAQRGVLQAELAGLRADVEDLRATRAALIARRDAPETGSAARNPCLDPQATNTASVHWHAPMYGQTAYAMRGEFICNLQNGYTQMIASQLRVFHCDMDRNPPDCRLADVAEFRIERHPEIGTRYMLDNGSWFVLRPPF